MKVFLISKFWKRCFRNESRVLDKSSGRRPETSKISIGGGDCLFTGCFWMGVEGYWFSRIWRMDLALLEMVSFSAVDRASCRN